MAESTNLPAVQSESQVPAYLQKPENAQVGMEWVTSRDLVFPRLRVVANQDRLFEQNPPPANPGDLWHTTGKKVYCPKGGSIRVYPIKVQQEFLHWAPRTSGKGCLERSTDPHGKVAKLAARQLDDLQKRGVKVDTNKEESYNESHSWLFIDADSGEPFVVNFSKGNIHESKQMLSRINMKRVQLQAFKLQLFSWVKVSKPHPAYQALDMRFSGWADEARFNDNVKIAENFAKTDLKSDALGEDETGAPPEYATSAGTEVS